MSEVFLVIIWSKAQNKKQSILQDLSDKFKILDVYNITWTKDKFAENLSRFYGQNLPKNSHKEKHCGNGTFTCIIVRDKSPVYGLRKTSKGTQIVNTNLFDAKELYRNWTGGGHKIHATDNVKETKQQVILLLNKTYRDYADKNVNIKEKKYQRDLIGANDWDSLGSIFNVLNETVNYVILRNFENLESTLTSSHPDIDLLVENKQVIVSILNAKATNKKKHRVQYSVSVNHKKINFDLRYVGDNYYCAKWERNILVSRVKKEYFYVPNKENHFFSLLYHSILHKEYILQDYIFQLTKFPTVKNMRIVDFMGVAPLDILNAYMDKHDYCYTEPNDPSVYWNHHCLSKKMYNTISLSRKITMVYTSYKKKVKHLLKKTLGFLLE